jgi:hypothetical protein
MVFGFDNEKLSKKDGWKRAKRRSDLLERHIKAYFVVFLF